MRPDGLRDELQGLRRENEQLLLAQHQSDGTMERYLDLFEDAPLGYLVLEGAGAIGQLNDLAADLLGGVQDRQHLIGIRLRSLVAESDRELLAQHLRRCAVERKPLGCELHLGRAHLSDELPSLCQMIRRNVLTEARPGTTTAPGRRRRRSPRIWIASTLWSATSGCRTPTAEG